LRGGIVTGNALTSPRVTGQRCLANAGLSSRRCHGLTTRGVRADRVGVALSFQLAARQVAERPSGARGSPAAQAAGDHRRTWLRLRFVPWPVKPRLVTVSRLGSVASASNPGLLTALPVLDAGSVGWRGYGRAGSAGPSAARWRTGFGLFVAEPTPESGESGARERTLAPLFCTRGGDRTIPWSCSRIGLVAEVDERRLVPVRKDRGSSPLAFVPTPRAGPELSG
jgi:hypothetical protein